MAKEAIYTYGGDSKEEIISFVHKLMLYQGEYSKNINEIKEMIDEDFADNLDMVLTDIEQPYSETQTIYKIEVNAIPVKVIKKTAEIVFDSQEFDPEE